MRAMVYQGPGEVSARDMPMPTCEDGGLLVKVEVCLVCGSDLKAFRSGNPRLRPPIILGHEFCGIVVEDRSRGRFPVGGRVVMATSVSCGECGYCRRGWSNLCRDLRPMGFCYHGGMAEYVAIPERAVRAGHVIRTPDDMPPLHAALAEPVSCAVNACENSGVGPGDMALVMGAGPMGILNALAARACGATRVALSEINPARLAAAAAFDLDRLVDPNQEDLAQAVREETNGLGADVVIVAAPAAAPQEQAIELARKRGTICLFASLPVGRSLLSLDSRLIHYHELRLVGASDSTPAQVERAVAWLAQGRIPAERVISRVLPLEGFHEAIGCMEAGEVLRVALTPEGLADEGHGREKRHEP